MRKVILNILFCGCFIIPLVGSNIPVFAAAENQVEETQIENGEETDYDSIAVEEVVFPEEEVKKIEEEVEQLPLEMDKVDDTSTGSDQIASIGKYPTRKGVILVTKDKYKGLIPTGHAAIVWSSKSVIESTADGVKWGKNNWSSKKKTCYGVTVKTTTAKNDRGAANWCRNQIGKPYNYNYLNVKTRSKFYCSQLVWAAYKDKYGVDLNTSKFGKAIHPMELVESSKTRMIYKK